MIHGQAIPQGAKDGIGMKEIEIMADSRYEGHVEKRPGQVGDENCPQSAPQIVFIVERLVESLTVKHAEGR